jgi:NADH-quinone oxidoreductase subunit N
MSLVLPELFIGFAALFLLGFGAFRGDRALRSATLLAALALAVAAGLAVFGVDGVGAGGWSGFVVDPFARFVKAALFLMTAVVGLMTPPYLERWSIGRVEVPALLLFGALGMSAMVSAVDMLVLYLGLELLALVLYTLAALNRDHADASEAGLKYFVLSALASAVLLYGLSLLYGATGSLSFETLRSAQASLGAGVGAVFVAAGFGFKLALAPFHLWAPDVYENAPTPVTAFFATVPKLAAFAALARWMALGGLGTFGGSLLLTLGLLSLAVGGFGGLVQVQIKRLLAYSSIANMGTVALGLGLGSAEGTGAALFYAVLYLIATLGVFAVLLSFDRGMVRVARLDDLVGLGRRQPWAARLLAFFLFSLAGVPPLAGFFGKYVLFLAVVKAGLAPLALFGVLASVASAGYYLRIVRLMFFEASEGDKIDLVPDRTLATVRWGLAVLVVVLVLVPSPLVEGASAVAAVLSPSL